MDQTAAPAVPLRALTNPTSTWRWLLARPLVLVAGTTLLGLALRILGAWGDLWLDEIWSSVLARRAGSLHAIFFALPYDSNHVLNTAWLGLVGPDAAPVIARSAAILIGTLSIPAGALLAARRHPALAPAGAALVAIDFLFVFYGSEARGYAGLLTGGLFAILAFEHLAERPGDRVAWAGLGLATAFGTFSHLTMVSVTAAIGATAAIRGATYPAPVRSRFLLSVFTALTLGTLPALGCFVLSVLSTDGLHRGNNVPFSGQTLLQGLGRLSEAMLGLPIEDRYLWPAVLLAGFLTVAALAYVDAPRRIFPALAIYGASLLHVMFRIPEEQYARFHIVAALGALVLAIDVIDKARRGPRRIWFVVLLVFGLLSVGNAINLTCFFAQTRGHFLAATRLITAGGGNPRVTIEPLDLFREMRETLLWDARLIGARLEVVPLSCESPPDWLIHVSEPTAPVDAPETLTRSCRIAYERQATYPAYGLSGFVWEVYRRSRPPR